MSCACRAGLLAWQRRPEQLELRSTRIFMIVFGLLHLGAGILTFSPSAWIPRQRHLVPTAGQTSLPI
jgi:hypothetical protein